MDATSDPAPPLRRILLAEDEPHVRRILRSVLEGEFDIDVATDGEEAFALLDSEVVYDLVLTDLMMPVHSGLEVLARAKHLEHRRQLPVILLTAKGQDADRERALSLGAEDFITKPFSPKKLLARIRELIPA